MWQSQAEQCAQTCLDTLPNKLLTTVLCTLSPFWNWPRLPAWLDMIARPLPLPLPTSLIKTLRVKWSIFEALTDSVLSGSGSGVVSIPPQRSMHSKKHHNDFLLVLPFWGVGTRAVSLSWASGSGRVLWCGATTERQTVPCGCTNEATGWWLKKENSHLTACLGDICFSRMRVNTTLYYAQTAYCRSLHDGNADLTAVDYSQKQTGVTIWTQHAFSKNCGIKFLTA